MIFRVILFALLLTQNLDFLLFLQDLVIFHSFLFQLQNPTNTRIDVIPTIPAAFGPIRTYPTLHAIACKVMHALHAYLHMSLKPAN